MVIKYSNTDWINGTPSTYGKNNHDLTPEGIIVQYKILNDVCFLKLNLALYDTAPQSVIAKFDNWKYGELLFTFGGFGDRGGTNEGKSIKIKSNGDLIHNLKEYTGQYSCFLTGVTCCPIN